MSVALRGLMRNAVRRVQVRNFAAEPPKEGEMALTFAAGNKVHVSRSRQFLKPHKLYCMGASIKTKQQVFINVLIL